MNREHVMLAATFKMIDVIPKNHLWSIKYDGMRALWLPTCRGRKVRDVPYSADLVSDRVCTGLFSRYGKVIHAPDSFLDQLPDFPIDGELWTGRRDFQRIISICRSHAGNWEPVKFCVFDAPRYVDVFTDGRINNSQIKEMQIRSCDNQHLCGKNFDDRSLRFRDMYNRLAGHFLPCHPVIQVVQQHILKDSEVRGMLEAELALGGEGVIGRAMDSVWVPKRSKSIIKIKPATDAEAVIVEYTSGEGKYSGMLGAYLVRWNNKRFKLSGMTDYDREHPLAIGTTVTFSYRTLTDDGVPKEARFLREYFPL